MLSVESISNMSMLGAGKRLVIIGCGLSGLSYAHYLRNFLSFHKKHAQVSKITLLEIKDYMGGSVKSNVFDDNVVHELGPRSIRYNGIRAKNTVALIEQLGLGDRLLMIPGNSAAGKNRYIYKDAKLWKFPVSLTGLFSKLPGSETRLIQCLRHDFKAKKLNLDDYYDNDPSLYEFVAHRFGEAAAESVIDPLLRGITAGDARQLSTRAIFGALLDMEQKHGSITRGFYKPTMQSSTHDELFPNDILCSKILDKFQKDKVTSFNLSTGLQTLPEHLCNSLLNTNDDNIVSIYNRTKVKKINLTRDNEDEAPLSVTVETVDGDSLDICADHIISTIPAKDLVAILPETLSPEYKKCLKYLYEIPFAPVGCVAVEYQNIKSSLPAVAKSFGLLTHSKAGSRVLGISFDSTMFPEIDKHSNSFRLTCMMGGHWFEDIFGTCNPSDVNNAQLEQIALEEIEKILQIRQEPHRMTSYLWTTGIAQYRPGHVGRLQETRANIEQLKLPLTLLGQSYDGVSINDVIFNARLAADAFVKSL